MSKAQKWLPCHYFETSTILRVPASSDFLCSPMAVTCTPDHVGQRSIPLVTHSPYSDVLLRSTVLRNIVHNNLCHASPKVSSAYAGPGHTLKQKPRSQKLSFLLVK